MGGFNFVIISDTNQTRKEIKRNAYFRGEISPQLSTHVCVVKRGGAVLSLISLSASVKQIPQ